MIEAIKEIGNITLKHNPSLLENIVLGVDREIKKEQHTVILNYNIFDKKIEVDFEEISKDTKLRYLWVGNAPSNSDKIYFTTSTLRYLLSQTILKLMEKSSGNGRLKDLLQLTLKEMFYDTKLSKSDRYIIDVEKCGLCEKGEISKWITEAKKKNSKESAIFKNILKEVESRVSEFIKEETSPANLTRKDIGLYTLKINGRLMVKDEEYRELIIKEKIGSSFGKKKAICSLCNGYQAITGDLTKFKLKYYITDKMGFSSNLSGDFTKSFTLCEQCYKNLLVGEVFVRNKLTSYVGGLNLYIIPKFIFPLDIPSGKLSEWAEYINFTFNSYKSMESLKEFENKLEIYKDYVDKENNYILNLLFFRKSQSEFKVLKLIKDVPPTRFKLLIETGNAIKNDIIEDKKILEQSNQWAIGLENISHLIPLRKRQNEVEYKKVLSLYDAIFSKKPVSYDFLIRQFVELAQVYRFKNFGSYNIKKPKNSDVELVYAILKANLFILYLQKLGLLKGGACMDYESLQLNDKLKGFIKEMNYDESKTALFLLGYLIGEVGKAQYDKVKKEKGGEGTRNIGGAYKTILNKITYQGMNKGKIIRLSNDVFEKLREYKKLQYNERMFAECKRLLGRHIESLPSDQENVFYVLSGYAYITHQAISEKREG